MNRRLTRGFIAETVSRWSATEKRALFVGNGYLIREIIQRADSAGNFYLFGGMGLASAMAAGYVSCRVGGKASVLEGDGNFLMGLSGALYCGSNGLDVIHYVYANGVYESSGGQIIPCTPQSIDLMVRGMGYQCAYEARTEAELSTVLSDCRGRLGPILVWMTGAADANVSPRPRPSIDMRDVTFRFQSFWAASARPDIEG